MNCSAIQSDFSSDSDSDNGSESSTKDGDDLSDDECGEDGEDPSDDECGASSFSNDDWNSQDILSKGGGNQVSDKESSNKVTGLGFFNNDIALPIQEEAESKDGKEEDFVVKTLPKEDFDSPTEAARSTHKRAPGLKEKSQMSGMGIIDIPLLRLVDNASQVFDQLRYEGVEVLKLNREKNWQSRILTVTAEIQFVGNGSFPVGLLWLKKFDRGKSYTLASIDKKGKGGMLFDGIEFITVTKDNHGLSRKQKKKFKDSITLALYSNNPGTKREVLFRCITKEDAFALSSGFQAILDHIKSEQKNTIKNLARERGQLKVITTTDSMQELGSTIPVESDQWEL